MVFRHWGSYSYGHISLTIINKPSDDFFYPMFILIFCSPINFYNFWLSFYYLNCSQLTTKLLINFETTKYYDYIRILLNTNLWICICESQKKRQRVKEISLVFCFEQPLQVLYIILHTLFHILFILRLVG